MTNNSHFPPKKVYLQNEWNNSGLLSTLDKPITETTSSNKKQMETATVISQDI